jgi:hypothetical protein
VELRVTLSEGVFVSGRRTVYVDDFSGLEDTVNEMVNDSVPVIE